MPQQPDAPVGPNIEVDVDQKYVVQLIDLEETPSKFRDQRKDAMSIIWKVNLWNQTDGVAVIDGNSGLLYELWQFSPDTTYANPKTGKKAKAREWTEAFMGRDLSDDEMKDLIRDGFKESLVEKRAVADLEWYSTENGIERLRIIRLRPYRQPAKNGTAAKPELVTAGGAAESREERKARLQRELEEADKE